MGTKAIAVVVSEEGQRFQISNWDGGSYRHSSNSVTRPAKIHALSEDMSWNFLEEWQAPNKKGTVHIEEDDFEILKEGLKRLLGNYGVTPDTIVYQPEYVGMEIPDVDGISLEKASISL